MFSKILNTKISKQAEETTKMFNILNFNIVL